METKMMNTNDYIITEADGPEKATHYFNRPNNKREGIVLQDYTFYEVYKRDFGGKPGWAINAGGGSSMSTEVLKEGYIGEYYILKNKKEENRE